MLLPITLLLPLVCSGLITRLEIRSTGSLRTRLIKEGVWTSIVDKIRQNLAIGSQPFLDYFDGFYQANITLGQPPQHFTVALDTGSANFWVISDKCRILGCKGFTTYNKKRYQIESSSTARLHSPIHKFSLRYGTGWTRGYYVTDFLSVGANLYFPNQTFGVAESIADVFGYQPVDGILGLAWPSLGERDVTPPMQNLMGQLDEHVFTVWIDRWGL